jgi:succinyl-CoA synthetase beta subunit
MRLSEYQTKQIFARYGIPVPRGRVASSSREVSQIAEELGGQVVIKAQVLVHARGRMGGIRVARSVYEAEQVAMQILGMELGGLPVHKVLVDELIAFEDQYYIAIETDYAEGKPKLTAYTIVRTGDNGNGVQEQNRFEQHIDPLFGLLEYQVRDVAIHLDLPRDHWSQFHNAVSGLWQVYWESDALSTEINPLVIRDDNGLISLDGTIDLDDEALFRHLELAEMRDFTSDADLQNEARKYGFNLVPFDGSIGTISNGAGLAVATVDAIQYHGGTAANYLDAGACHTPEKVSLALKLTMNGPGVTAILVNFFGGISHCAAVAEGIKELLQEQPVTTPIIVRLTGDGALEAQQILADLPVAVVSDFSEAIHTAIQQSTPANGGVGR